MLKEKRVRQSPKPILSDYVMVPQQILSANQHIVISGDIFFVSKIPFLTTISQTICLTMVHYLMDQKLSTILKGLTKVAAIYANRGFIVKHALMDGQFKPLHDDLTSIKINLNMMVANEHIPLIE